MVNANYGLVCLQDCRSPRTLEVLRLLFKKEKKVQAMFVSLLETEDEGEYVRDTSGQDFAANFHSAQPRWKTRICGLKNQRAL